MKTNIIYNKDCIEGMKKLPDESVDMILCDLPYGTTNCKWDKVLPLDELWKQYKRILKEDGVVVLTASQPFTTDLINSNRDWFRYCWVWKKSRPSGFLLAKKMPMKEHEDIVVFYKKASKYFPQGLKDCCINQTRKASRNKGYTNVEDGGKKLIQTKTNYPRSVLSFSSGHNTNIHPTQKPVSLFEYLIKTYTNEGELVLDNCIGSGTTAIACINTNRQFIGYEIDPQYYKISLERLSDKTSTSPNGDFATQKSLIGIKRKPRKVSQSLLRKPSLNSDIMFNLRGRLQSCEKQ
jgi:site-specific DNA-methyltransferase (adenine-specific)